MRRFLRRKINTVFLMLGNSCNLNCRYCLQHPLVNKALPAKINSSIFDFLSECAAELDEGEKLHIQFYGGEPLLYFEAIKEVVQMTKKYAWFSVITNGKALTKDMVLFFNENNFSVTVSWDGFNTISTRGYDVFKENRENILSLKRLGLSAVMSSKAYPKEILEAFQEVSDDYYKIHGYQVNINIDEIFDTGCIPCDLLDVEYGRVESEMYELSKFYLEKRLSQAETDLKDYTKLAYIDRFFGMLKRFYVSGDGGFHKNYCSCGNGYDVINLDLEGNLYPCHNTSKKAGSIYDDYFRYLNSILKTDPTKLNKEKCSECPAIAFCGGGCKLVDDKAREYGYCRLKKAVFLPVLQVFDEYGKKIEGGQNGC